ncbi:9775_t:CDS:2 [Gigaspora margarita]|uniref:9775_t:CDS:1 n=1 Tax=Gigaspora margarita TaxID=4874 RepID=A0ABN7UQ10_GIGMA|nr:9775_t:CDS:2 [Gigaspora margarita]
MIISVHYYLKNKKDLLTQQSDETIYLRKEVSLATGVGKATIALTSSNQGHQSPQKFQAEYLEAIHNLIISANKNDIPLSLRMLVLELSEIGFSISKMQLAIHLHKLGYHYGKGERQNILHETPQNIAYRARYFRRRFENIQDSNNVPTLPKFLKVEEVICL